MNNEQQVQQDISDYCAQVVNYMHGIALVMDAEWEADRAETARMASVVVPDALAALTDAADRVDQLIADELWPEDTELVAEIRATFLREWGMDEQQADARMSRFDYRAALAEMEVVA